MLLKHPVCEMSSLRKVFTRTLIKKLAQLNNWVEFSRSVVWNRKGKVWEFRCDGKIGGADKCYHCGHRGATDGFPSAPKNRLLKCQTCWLDLYCQTLLTRQILQTSSMFADGLHQDKLEENKNEIKKNCNVSKQEVNDLWGGLLSDPFDPPTYSAIPPKLLVI